MRMKKIKRTFPVLLASMLICGGLAAQENDFDLGSQRSESQEVNLVPGQALDHHGLIINPTPHSLQWIEGKMLDISRGFRLKGKQSGMAGEMDFLTIGKKGADLRIDFGIVQAKKKGVKPVSGAYELVIDSKGVCITAYDEKGAFYGLQTLRAVMESPVSADGKLPCLTVNDYPDLPYRGVVEGFYGTPWSHEVRLSLIDFYGKFKMNYYLYGPKDDPYHSCPNWRQPYPEKDAGNIRELVEACNRNRVDFVWAIHPGQDIKWNEEDYRNLVNKFNWMYDLGVRSFAIFFDDISGEGTNPNKQTALLNRLHEDFVKVKEGVAPLIVCPTDYSKLWANPTPKGSLAIYGKTLDPSINVFWTGDVVCSDLTRETMDWVNSRIQRPALYWWNFPVTDYARHIIMQGPTYGLDTTLTDKEVCGLISNPMEHGEASKLALYSVADYGWNIAGYNAIDSWERGLAELAPEVKDAYRTFAIHSCDTETGYRRAESWETKTFRMGDTYTQADYDALLQEFEKVEKTPAVMEAECKNQLLMDELRPWLVEFGKLGTRGKKALQLMNLYKTGNSVDFWSAYIDNLMALEDLKAYNEHKMGTMKLQPFYENAMDDLLAAFYIREAGKKPATCRAIGSFPTLATTQSKLMFDNDTTTYYTSGTSQNDYSWMGVDLGQVKPVWEVFILQGRNSKDDVDYFDRALLEYSVDGKTWTTLSDTLEKQYVVRWTGTPVEARYIRLKKLHTSKTNWAAIRSFEVNPVREEKLNFTVESERKPEALLAFDELPATSFVNEGLLAFTLPEGTTAYTLLMRPIKSASYAKLRQLDADGRVLSDTVLNGSYVRIERTEECARIEIEGCVELFEVIFLK